MRRYVDVWDEVHRVSQVETGEDGTVRVRQKARCARAAAIRR